MVNLSPSIITKHFASIESLEAQYCNVPGFRVVQLEKGPLDCRIYRLVLDQAIFEFRHLNTPLRIFGEKSTENLTFELVISPFAITIFPMVLILLLVLFMVLIVVVALI